MRNLMLEALIDLAREDKDLVLLTGDLGFGVFEGFAEEFPDQFFNIGIAEQNMMGVAAGLALEGKKVFAYSIGNFPTFRCLEQIRNDLAYHELNVNIICQGGGFNYGGLGMSHHATEDLAIMRALPAVTVVVPYCPEEAKQAVYALYNNSGVGYLRIEKSSISDTTTSFSLSQATELVAGDDISLVSCGGIVDEALAAAKELKASGISCRVINMSTLKPFDSGIIIRAAKETGLIITLEEHNKIGGLGSAVAEVVAEEGLGVKVRRIGMDDSYSSVVGDQAYLRQYYGMNCETIVNIAKDLIGTGGGK